MLSRCYQLFALLVFLTATAASPAPLRVAAEHAGLLIGTAVRPSLFSEAAYSATLAREFNMVEPEDAMKWWMVRSTLDRSTSARPMKSSASRKLTE